MKILTYWVIVIVFVTLISSSCGANKQKEHLITNELPLQPVNYDKNMSCLEVKKIASEILAIAADSIKPESTLVGLGIAKNVDDIRYIELLMHVEAEFEIEIPDNQAEKFKTIGELCNYVDEQTK